MTIICINDIFSENARKFYEQHKVVTPQEGLLYTIRDIARTRHGTGLLLEELKNPRVYLEGEGENAMYGEPSWGLFRFKNVDNTEVTYEQLTNHYELNTTTTDNS